MTTLVSLENQIIQEAIHDREALRVELLPEFVSNSRTRDQSAFLLGRLMNELRFVLQTTWLGLPCDSERLELVIQGCEATARGLFSNDSTFQQQIETEVQYLRGRVQAELSSEFRSDVLHELEVLYSSNEGMVPDIDEDFGTLTRHAEGLETLLEPIIRLVQRQCESGLYPAIALAQSFEIGKCVNQGIHPPFHRGALCLRLEVPELQPTWEAPRQATEDSGWRTQVSVSPAWLNYVWRVRAIQAMDQRGVWPTRRTSSVGLLPHIIDSVQSQFGLSSSNGAPSFGLMFNSATREVSKSGSPFVATLPRQLFNLLHHFAYAGVEPTSLRWLVENWSQFGEGPTSNRTRVDTAINSLRNAIERWQLTIENTPGAGWFLTEV